MSRYNKKKFILDCDPGIDDALAILLLTNFPEISLEAITTVSGNVPLNLTSINAVKTLEAIGVTDVPVYRGSKAPLKRKPVRAYRFHGRNGLGDADIPAPEKFKVEKQNAVTFLANTVKNSTKGEYGLVATGPLTNIALAVKRFRGFAGMLDKLVIMGGAFGLTRWGFGNDTPAAEFNIFSDPEAAKIVFNSGANIIAVGLDVTTNPLSIVTKGVYDRIRDVQNERARFASAIMSNRMKWLGRFELHDPMAAAIAVDPSLAKTSFLGVDVETNGSITSGQTVVDRRVSLPNYSLPHAIKPNVNVCVEVDNRRFLEFFLDGAINATP